MNKTNGIVLSEDRQKELYASMLRWLRDAESMKLCGKLLEAVVFYQTRELRLHLADGISWDAFLQQLNTNAKEIDRHMSAGKLICEWAEKNYTARKDEPFIVSDKMVMQFVKERHDANLPLSLNAVHKDRLRQRDLIQHINGEAQMPEFALEMSRDNSAKELPAAPAQGDLFAMENRIKKAGYVLGSNGKYIHPSTGEEMTRAQLAEFVDDEAAFYLFKSTKKMLGEMHDKLQGQQQYVEFTLAYMETHSSPESERLLAEAQKELADLASHILFFATTILHED